MISIKKSISVILVIIISILLLSGCVNQSVPKEISVPKVIGLSYTQAVKELEESGVKNISSNIDEYSMLDKEKLVVVKQNISGNTMDDQTVSIEVNAKYTGRISVSYLDDDNPKDKADVRLVINGETVAVVSPGHTVEWEGEYQEPVIYINFIDAEDSTNGIGTGTGFEGDFNWIIHIKNNGELEVTYQSVHVFIAKQ